MYTSLSSHGQTPRAAILGLQLLLASWKPRFQTAIIPLRRVGLLLQSLQDCSIKLRGNACESHQTPTMDPAAAAPHFEFTTIAEVDAAVEANASLERIRSDGIPEYIGPRLTAFEVPFFERSLELRQLTFLKYFYGQSQEVTRAHVQERERNRAAAWHPTRSPRKYLDSFRKAFRDINDASDNAFGRKVHRFLDLGCAPGGFATWLLKNNRNARGTGITLSSEAKGLRLQLEPSIRGRFQAHYEDVCRVAMGRVALSMYALVLRGN